MKRPLFPCLWCLRSNPNWKVHVPGYRRGEDGYGRGKRHHGAYLRLRQNLHSLQIDLCEHMETRIFHCRLHTYKAQWVKAESIERALKTVNHIIQYCSDVCWTTSVMIANRKYPQVP